MADGDEPGALQTLWDDAPCGLAVTDDAGVFRKVNATFSTWLGYASSELVGIMRFQDLLPLGARVFLQTHWTPILQLQGSVSEVVLEFKRRDGTRIPMMLNAIRRQRNGGIVDDIAALVVNDRKLYERELLIARTNAESTAADLRAAKGTLRILNAELSLEHRRKDIFIATLAHELRNPLAPMANVVQVLRGETHGSERQRWATDVLSRQVTHMSHLVDDLLDVSRITEGKVELRREHVELGDTLRLAAEEVMSSVASARQTLTMDIHDQPIWLHADPTRVTQIAVNLLNNASKYSQAGAHIHVASWAEADVACFTVCDDGMGIAPEHLLSIFDMFAQLEPALERASGGLGIGLALVKGLIDLHAGTIIATSGGPGAGSCFTVRLPAVPAMRDAAEQPVPDQAPASLPGEAVKVVIVDDNRDAADTLAMVLDLMERETRVAYTAASGIDTIASFAPAVAILDIGLPDMNGYEMARQLRQTSWGQKVVLIAVTGWGQDTDKHLATEAGFDAHFTKPVDFKSLNDALAQLVDQRSSA